MQWVSDLQDHVVAQSNVGAASSVVDVLKKVQFELLSRAEGSNSLADSREKIAQYLFIYEMSGGSPDDLFKFITPGQDRVNIWVQMHQGDNQKVRAVVDAADVWIADNPAPVWNGNPFSVYTRAEKVFIDGSLVFDLEKDLRPVTDFELGLRVREL